MSFMSHFYIFSKAFMKFKFIFMQNGFFFVYSYFYFMKTNAIPPYPTVFFLIFFITKKKHSKEMPIYSVKGLLSHLWCCKKYEKKFKNLDYLCYMNNNKDYWCILHHCRLWIFFFYFCSFFFLYERIC